MILNRNHQDRVLTLCPDFKTSVFLEGSKYLSYLSYIAAFSLVMQSYNVRLVAHAVQQLAVSKHMCEMVRSEQGNTKRAKLLTTLLQTSMPSAGDITEDQIVQKIKKQLQSYEGHLIALLEQDDPEADDFKILFRSFPKYLSSDKSN